MIRIEHRELLDCPFLICDGCGRKITDADNAIVTWGESRVPRYLHKIKCDDRTDSCWIPLREHLAFLLHNSGLKTFTVRTELKKYRDTWGDTDAA